MFMKDPSSCSHVQRHSRPPAAVLRVPSRARNATRHDPHHAPVRTSACSCKAIAVARISYCERQDPCEQCQEVREQPLVPLWPARDATDSVAFRPHRAGTRCTRHRVSTRRQRNAAVRSASLPMHPGGRFPAQPRPRGLRTLCVWSLQVIGCGQCTVAGTGERLCEPGR